MGNENVVVAVEERTEEFRGMIRLNSTAAFLWKLMENDCTEESLARELFDKYSITEEQAAEAVSAFVAKLSDAGVLDL